MGHLNPYWEQGIHNWADYFTKFGKVGSDDLGIDTIGVMPMIYFKISHSKMNLWVKKRPLLLLNFNGYICDCF